MMIAALELINYSILLFFGVIVSIDFSGIENFPKNHRAIFLFLVLLALIQFICWDFLGLNITVKIYPFITHVPLIIFMVIRFKHSWLYALVCVLSAYLCCQTPRLIGTIIRHIFNSSLAFYIGNTITIFPLIYFLRTYIALPVSQIMNYSKKFLLIFGIVPFMYYLFDYATTVYTNLLYDGAKIAVEFMPSVVSIIYFIFIMIYYKEIQQRNKIENDYVILSMQANQSKKEISSLIKQQEQTAYYRHDLRHHLMLIKGYINSGDIDKVKSYIVQAEDNLNAITPKYFCHNETVNLILGAFDSKAKQKEVSLSIDVDLPKTINIKDTELCSIISNGLENAINAASFATNKNLRCVRINCKIHKSKLLIFIENSYVGKVIIENGIPKTNTAGHGFGTKSIVTIVEKYEGYSSFEANSGIFTMRLVIPLS